MVIHKILFFEFSPPDLWAYCFLINQYFTRQRSELHRDCRLGLTGEGAGSTPYLQ